MPSREENVSNVLAKEDLQKITDLVKTQAHQATGNIDQLLVLLRTLETLHREIRDGLFQEALPDNRQALHTLLREIESEGGWPYIPRMRLQNLLKWLEMAADES